MRDAVFWMELITDNGGGNIDYLLGRFIVLIFENLEHEKRIFCYIYWNVSEFLRQDDFFLKTWIYWGRVIFLFKCEFIVIQINIMHMLSV